MDLRRESKRFGPSALRRSAARLQSPQAVARVVLNVAITGQSGLGTSTLSEMLVRRADRVDRRTWVLDTSGTEVDEGDLTIRELAADVVSSLQGDPVNAAKARLTVFDVPSSTDGSEGGTHALTRWLHRRHVAHLEANDIEYQKRTGITAPDDRRRGADARIHVLIYLVDPFGRSPDYGLLREWAQYTNVIPVIARADMLDTTQRASRKAAIAAELERHNVPWYGASLRLAPEGDVADVDTLNALQSVADEMPFAIVASTKTALVDGKQVLARQYRWGVVNVEDATHCETAALVRLLLHTHTEDLRTRTSDVLYEAVRTETLNQLKLRDAPSKP